MDGEVRDLDSSISGAAVTVVTTAVVTGVEVKIARHCSPYCYHGLSVLGVFPFEFYMIVQFSIFINFKGKLLFPYLTLTICFQCVSVLMIVDEDLNTQCFLPM